MKRAIILALMLVALYASAGFLLLPYLAKPRLERLLTDYVHGEMSIGKISFNPFTFDLLISDTSLQDQNGRKVVTIGRLSVDANLWPLTEDRLVLSDAALSNLIIFDPDLGDEILTIPAVKLAGANYEWTKNSLVLKDLRFDRGKVKLSVTETGTLRLTDILNQQLVLSPSPSLPSEEDTSQKRKSDKFDLAINRFELDDYSFVLASSLSQTPGEWSLNKIEISVKHFRLADGSRIPLEINFAGNSGGTVKMLGDVVMQPLQIRVKIGLDKLPLKELSSIAEVHGITLAAGALTSSLDLDLSLVDPPSLKIDGNIQIDGPKLLSSELTQPLFTAGNVALETLQVTGFPLIIRANSLAFTEPSLHYQVGGANAQRGIAVTGPTQQPATQGTATTSGDKAPNLEIERVTVVNGIASILDKSTGSPLSHDAKELELTLNNLSLSSTSALAFSLTGKLYGEAPLAIEGTAVPAQLPNGINVSLKLDKAPLQAISTYASPYLGREIANGKVSATMKASFQDDKVQGENHFKLHHLALGRVVQSAKAISAPLETIISIMRDSRGEIDLDIPVAGKTNQPSFHYTKLLGDALRNTLLEFAASPFTLLSAIYDWNGAEIGKIEFTAGASTLAASELEKIKLLAKAILEKEGLDITITPSSSPREFTIPREDGLPQQSVTPRSAETLAITRGQLIKEGLIANGVPATRIFLSAPHTDQDVNNGIVVTELGLH